LIPIGLVINLLITIAKYWTCPKNKLFIAISLLKYFITFPIKLGVWHFGEGEGEEGEGEGAVKCSNIKIYY